MSIFLGDNTTHFKKYIGGVGVANNKKLEILLAHGVGGYNRVLGTIYVIGSCGGHSLARTGLVRHFDLSALEGYDEPTADIISYTDAFKSEGSDITIGPLDNADNIADCSSDNTDDFAMTILWTSTHTNDAAGFQVWAEFFGQTSQFTISIQQVG